MVGITWIVLWAIAGWLIGFLLYIVGGFAVHAPFVRTPERVSSVANHYTKMAMKMLDRGVLVERGTKYDLYRASHDPEKGADSFKLDGEEAHVTNETGLLSTLHKRPFGLVAPPDDNVSVYVSPEVGEVGRKETERRENNDLQDDDGYVSDINLSGKRPLVQLKDYARAAIPGNRSFFDLTETIDLYEQSQRMFGQDKTTQFMILIIAYGVAMIGSWLVLTQAGGAVPAGGIEVPI